MADGTRKINVPRPEGRKSIYPGKTIFVSDFSVPKRIQSREVAIYNNTYLIASASDPHIEFNAGQLQVLNNLFVVEEGGRLAKKLNVAWEQGEGLAMRGNAFIGNVSPNFIRLDHQPTVTQLIFSGQRNQANSYAVPISWLKSIGPAATVQHPSFPAAGKGIFSHVRAVPKFDYFGNPLSVVPNLVGAGYCP